MNSRASPAAWRLAENLEESLSCSPPENLRKDIFPFLLRACLLEVHKEEEAAAH